VLIESLATGSKSPRFSKAKALNAVREIATNKIFINIPLDSFSSKVTLENSGVNLERRW
jgi:hypothetical protein